MFLASRQYWSPPGMVFIVTLLSHVFSSRRLDDSFSSQWGDEYVITDQEQELNPLPAALQGRKEKGASTALEQRAGDLIIVLTVFHCLDTMGRS